MKFAFRPDRVMLLASGNAICVSPPKIMPHRQPSGPSCHTARHTVKCRTGGDYNRRRTMRARCTRLYALLDTLKTTITCVLAVGVMTGASVVFGDEPASVDNPTLKSPSVDQSKPNDESPVGR